MSTPNPPSRSGPFIATAMVLGAIVAFVIPGGIVFGVLLLLLSALFITGLVTGMNPHAGIGATSAHLENVVMRTRTGGPHLNDNPAPAPAQPSHEPTPIVDTSAPPPVPPIAPTPMPQRAEVTGVEPETVPENRNPVAPEARDSPAASPVSLTKGQLPEPVFAPTPPPGYGIPQPPQPGSSRSRAPKVAIAIVAVFLLLVGAGTYTGYRLWQSGSPDTTSTAFAPNMLHRAFPTVPSAAFAIGPQQFGSEYFTRPNYLIGGEESIGYLRSDRYLITGVGDGALVAIDPATGKTAWRQSDFPGIHCSDVFDDQSMGCATSDGRLVLLSAKDGSLVADLPGGYSRVKKFGDKYAYAKTEDSTATVSLGTRTNPTAYWTHSETIPGGTRTYLEVSKGIIAYTDGSYSGGWSLAYNAAGKKVSQTTDFGTLLGDDMFTNTPGDSALIYDSSGRMRYMEPSRPTQPRLYAPAPGLHVAFTRDSAIDPTDGKVLWPRPLTPESSAVDIGVVAVVGSVAVLRSDNGSVNVGVDVRTGRTLWTNPTTTFGYDLVTDGRRIIGMSGDIDNSQLIAIDVATGEQSYNVSIPDLGALSKAVAVGDDLVVVGAAAVVGFHPTGGTAVLWDGRGGPAQTPSNGPVTPCATPPTVTPTNFAVDAQNLVVRLQFSSGCTGGDVLSNSQYQVTVRDQSSVIASTTFDLSTTPVPVAGGNGQTVREFSFPAGTYFRLPSSLSGGSGSSTTVSAGGETAQCSGNGTNSVAAGQQYSPTSAMTAPVVGSAQGSAASGVDTAANAIDALRAQADADRPLVQSQYLDRWLAQISAKQIRNPPMMATDVDDRTVVAWTPEQILRQHLDLRARYPEVRLLFSDEWRTIDLKGWWITVAQPNVLDAEGANAWCDSKAIAPNQCFAKLVSNNRDSDGTTQYRR